ncbi:apicoplast ribosomal protein S17 (apicoplast) [Plasmodium berghei]|uniref:Apicoplast ribosomal protein S17 n=2 Tax=Plasmodium berghei TaxID=5821 RepID=A0A509ARS2_PLABA|nr:apicoplast ribosomal protein S17 [Plasmodium berghei]VUC58760.1 apicoplast ribosomal protein S17 [Plasmodium berghei ANKA]SCL99438.1 apicoplast ribosomal protein S17 [Plasmodium berghei]SCM16948.1 apicoplast ribosomal protein S17 [Plasmodium berghei]SCM18742.1 apicoplast ribosomal protein S17 [Plasmodium berghei]|eukprot:YP_009273037.1 apicoplast ribosomal protein S17 (apicoplast) [Plasmodium berghei]
MIVKIGYVIKRICDNIKIVCISYYKYSYIYKKLLLCNKYIKVYDKRNEIVINDYVLIKYYKKSKFCNNKIIKIL